MFSHFRTLIISIITLSLSFSTTLLNVDFETEGSGYTASATEGTGFTDVFNRSNPDVGGNSSFLWAFEDLSVENPTLTLNQINVSGYDSFSFSIDLLAHHYNDWDPTTTEDNLKIYYTVKRGDTLSKIAENHRVRMASIMKWNKLNKANTIFPGQKLAIWIKQG